MGAVPSQPIERTARNRAPLAHAQKTTVANEAVTQQQQPGQSVSLQLVLVTAAGPRSTAAVTASHSSQCRTDFHRAHQPTVSGAHDSDLLDL